MTKKITNKKLEKINTAFYKSQFNKIKTKVEDFSTENKILKEELDAKNQILLQISSMYIADLDLFIPFLQQDMNINPKIWIDLKKWLTNINLIIHHSSEIIKKLEKLDDDKNKQLEKK